MGEAVFCSFLLLLLGLLRSLASRPSEKELFQGPREGKREDRRVLFILLLLLGGGSGGGSGGPSPAGRRWGRGSEPGRGRSRGRGFFFARGHGRSSERFLVAAVGSSPDSAAARRDVGPHLRRGAAHAHASYPCAVRGGRRRKVSERELEPLWMTRERGRDSSAPQKEMKVKPWVPGTWFCFSRLLQTSTPSTKLSSPVLERDKVFFSLSL